MASKQLIDLNAIDLTNIPVWEHWSENGIEYVKPSDKVEIFDDGINSYIVLTEFIFKNNTKHLGFCSPQDPSGLDYIQPVIFSEKGQVEIYKDHNLDKDQISGALDKLGFDFGEIFPIEYNTKINSNRKIYSGIITDFNTAKENVV